MQADIDYLKELQKQENYRFDVKQLGGKLAKNDRIRRLIPIFENGRFYLPDVLDKLDYEGKAYDVTHVFIEEEYKPFPVAMHDDLIDAISRIADEEMAVVWPRPVVSEDRYAKKKRDRRVSFMAA
jgi:phage terminase large subunit-like protein